MTVYEFPARTDAHRIGGKEQVRGVLVTGDSCDDVMSCRHCGLTFPPASVYIAAIAEAGEEAPGLVWCIACIESVLRVAMAVRDGG